MDSNERLSDLLSSALGTEVSTLLTDPLISEIRLNSDGSLWAHKLGVGKFKSDALVSRESARRAIYAVAYGVNEICNDDKPSISAELPKSGERFQGILPPLSENPVFAIRKKAVRIFSLSDLNAQGVLDESTKLFLTEAVESKKNILVIGGTDSGKTTFANALLHVLSQSKERIVILEDTRELQCEAFDVEYLRTRDGVATLRDLVRMTMRLSPDRIVIGEVRGPEALDLLKAWNTGHGGGVSTVHASSARQWLSRIEQLVQEAGVLPSRAMISEAVNVLVYMEKVGTKRIVKEVFTVIGAKSGEYEIQKAI